MATFTLDLSFPAEDFQREWQRCSLAANYAAAYAAYQFDRREQVENLISTVANEALETAVRLAPPDADLQFCLSQVEGGLRLNSTHPVRAGAAGPYLNLLGRLADDGRLEEMYLELLTSDWDTDDYFNQLGLTMIVHDFGARLAARPGSQPDRIHTEIFIPVEETAV